MDLNPYIIELQLIEFLQEKTVKLSNLHM